MSLNTSVATSQMISQAISGKRCKSYQILTHTDTSVLVILMHRHISFSYSYAQTRHFQYWEEKNDDDSDQIQHWRISLSVAFGFKILKSGADDSDNPPCWLMTQTYILVSGLLCTDGKSYHKEVVDAGRNLRPFTFAQYLQKTLLAVSSITTVFTLSSPSMFRSVSV